MNEAIDPLVSGGLGKSSGGIDATGLKLAPPPPIADLGRAVKHPCDARDGRLARRRIGQVAADDFDAELFQKIGAAARHGPKLEHVCLAAISRSAR